MDWVNIQKVLSWTWTWTCAGLRGEEDIREKKKLFLCQNKNIYIYNFCLYYFCCPFLPDYCLFCGFFSPRSAVNCEFFFRSSLIFSKILGFLERLRTFVKGGKKRRVSFLLLFLLLLSVSTVWGHIQSLGVYIKMHAFAISVCWLYKASLKTYYHCVCFFSLRTVVEKRVFLFYLLNGGELLVFTWIWSA